MSVKLNEILCSFEEDILIVLNKNNIVVHFSELATKKFNLKSADIIGRNFFTTCAKNHIQLSFDSTALQFEKQKKSDSKSEGFLKINASHHLAMDWKFIHACKNQTVQAILIIGRDMEELNYYKRNLNLSSSYLHNIVDNLPEYIYWKSADGIYLGCNKHVSESLGLISAQEIIGKSDYDFGWNKERIESLQKIDSEVMRNDVTISSEDVIPFEQGVKIMLSTKSPLRNEEGKIIGIVGVSTDITELKKNEKALLIAHKKAEEASHAKSIFISSMSHDIRTPLSGIIGTAEILENEAESKNVIDLAHIIHTSGEQLMQLINDILEVISAEEVTEENINLKTFSIKSRLNDINELITPNIELSHIKLNFSISQKVPEYIITDRVKFDRILLNLISNALKFTKKGTITVSVDCDESSEPEPIIILNISDTGVGIPPEEQEKIFERFYRISPSYDSKERGHGIGLFIVQKFVSILKGNITLTSKVGVGTTFRVELPIKVGTKEEANSVEEEKLLTAAKLGLLTPQTIQKEKLNKLKLTSPPTSKQSLRGLVVEDNDVARKIAKTFFEKAGFIIDDVEDAELGFCYLMQNPYDLVITDIGLPGMKGNELSELIRTWERITKRSPIPIIGLTAHGASKHADVNTGPIDIILSKPINDEKINQIIEKFFKSHSYSSDSSELPSSEAEQPPGLGFELPETEEDLFKLDAYPLLDEKEGLTILADNKEMLREVLSLLIEETIPEEEKNLKEAHTKQNWESIQSIAHKLKGGALYCGTIRMRYACQYLERYRLAGQSKLLEKVYHQLLTVLEATKLAVKKWLVK